MSETVALLKGVVTLEAAQAMRDLDAFGGKFDGFKGSLTGAFDPLKNALSGVVDFAISGVSAAAGFAKDQLAAAFGEVSQYEMLEISVRQLIASQLLSEQAASSMTDALTKAQAPAEDFLGWMQDIALHSAYGMEGVAGMARQVMAFGFGVDETKRFTEALIDFSTAAGVTPDGIQRISMSLGQMVARGKITGEELRELSRQMIPATSVLADQFGIATADMEKQIRGGAVSSGEALEMLVGWMEETYDGARLLGSTTFSGLTESIGDIKSMSLRNLFTGLFDSFKPMAVGLVDFLSGEEFQGTLTKVGTSLGDAINIGLGAITDFGTTFLDSDQMSGMQDFLAKVQEGEWASALGELVVSMSFSVMELGIRLKGIGEIIVEAAGNLIESMKVLIGELSGAFQYYFAGDTALESTPSYELLQEAHEERKKYKGPDIFGRNADPMWTYWNNRIPELQKSVNDELREMRAIDFGAVSEAWDGFTNFHQAALDEMEAGIEALGAKEEEALAKFRSQTSLREVEETPAFQAAAGRYGGVGRAQYEAGVNAVIGRQSAFGTTLDTYAAEVLASGTEANDAVLAIVDHLEGGVAHLVTEMEDYLVVPLAELPVGIGAGDKLRLGTKDSVVGWEALDQMAAEAAKSEAGKLGSTEAADALLKGMTPSEGATVDGEPYVAAMLAGVNSSIAASVELFKSAGQQIWAAMSSGIQAGFTAGASSSSSFYNVIDGMVQRSLAGLLGA